MAVGDTTANSVIWSPGETTGRSAQGVDGVAIPGDVVAATFSSGAPSAAPSGSPIYVNTANHKLYAWDGTVWVPVSGFNT